MKRIFIIAPFFPPSSMPPSQRVRLLVKHLCDFGWYPVVFTVDESSRSDAADPWMNELVGNQFDLVKVKCLDVNKTNRFGFGDLGLRMLPFLSRKIKEEIKKNRPEFILYPVPPWYTMTIAPGLKKATGVPYGIDFIDPWIFKLKHKNLKAVLSQSVAKLLERRVIKSSSAIFAVSQGILEDLKKRYSFSSDIPMVAVPYGVEVTDYHTVQFLEKSDPKIEIRYTGAISENMLAVMDSLLAAMKEVADVIPIRLIFTGSSYAAADIAKPALFELIKKNEVQDIVTENPARVGYREALEMNKGADLQLLVGDTTAYYAASKMMGLVASGRPFFAWVHAESFPAKFLEELKYPHRLFFLKAELGAPEKIQQLADSIILTLKNLDRFIPISLENPEFQKYTAREMTKTFVKTFQKIKE